MTWLQELLDSTLFQAFLAITAVLGFGWGFYSHFFNNKKQRISTAFSSFEIIKQGKNNIQHLSLFFAGKEIHDLTITKFAFWNSGNKVIRGTDIVSSQKLRVSVEDSSEILEAQIITESDSANSFIISETSSKEVCLDFDYVDSHEGIVLQVLHTGTIDSLKADVKIKGGKPIKHLNKSASNSSKSPQVQQRIKKTAAVLLGVTVAFLFTMVTTITLIEFGVIPNTALLSNIIVPANSSLLTVMLWILTFLSLFMTTIIIRKTFRFGVPGKLKSFGNSFDNE